MSIFWRRWLTGWCAAVGLFGLVLAVAGLPGGEAPARLLMRTLAGADPAFDAPLRFSVALMGCVTLGWALSLGVAFGAAHRLGDRATGVWRGLLGSALVWFVADSSCSILTGFGLNAVSNAVFMAALVLPLVRTGVLR